MHEACGFDWQVCSQNTSFKLWVAVVFERVAGEYARSKIQFYEG